MSEMRLLSVSIYLIDSILSCIYVRSFLKEKYGKRIVLAVWGIVCFLIQIAVFELLDGKFPIGKALGILFNVCVLLFMQFLFFKKDIQKQIFVTVSFLAGKETVSYITGVFNIALGGLCDKILDYFLVKGIFNTVEKAIIGIKIYNVIIVVLCALFYALLMLVYLRLISGKFVKKEYLLQMQENVFLILPCVAALCISVIIKMMIISVENGMTVIIYDTVPITKFWIPVICVLLLFTIISSQNRLIPFNHSTQSGKYSVTELYPPSFTFKYQFAYTFLFTTPITLRTQYGHMP